LRTRTYDTGEMATTIQGTGDITSVPSRGRKMDTIEAIGRRGLPSGTIACEGGWPVRSSCELNDNPWNAVYAGSEGSWGLYRPSSRWFG